MLGLVLLAMVVILLSYLTLRTKKPTNLPPGPKGWPLVGNGFQLDSNSPHLTLEEWARKYGNLYTINVFGKRIIVACDIDNIRQIYVEQSNTFAGRPPSYRTDVVGCQKDFAFVTYTNRFVQLKKLSIHALKMYGDGIQKLEDISLDIIQDSLDSIRSYNGKAFDIQDELKAAFVNVVSSLIFATKFSKDSRNFDIVLRSIDVNRRILASSMMGLLYDAFPFMRSIPTWLKKDCDWYRDVYLNDALASLIKEHKETRYDGSINCIMDRFLSFQESKEEGVIMDHETLSLCVSDLIQGGISTTSAALYAGLALLIVQPEYQKKAQEQIEETIGKRPPELSDRAKLPYIESMIFEILRYIGHLPLSLAHEAMEDTTLQGYNIPKGTEVWPCSWTLLHDPSLYEDPWKFKPDRFLDKDGQMSAPGEPIRKGFLTFGAGRRVCPGESMAKNRMFLFLTSYLQHFTFEADLMPPQTDPRTYKLGLVLNPQDYKLKAIPRS